MQTGKILVISPWEHPWSLGGEAGVADDYHFIRHFHSVGYELHFLRPRSSDDGEQVVHLHTYPNFFRPTRRLPTWVRRILWPLLFQLTVVPRAVSLARRYRVDLVIGHSHHSALAAFLAGRAAGAAHGVKLFGVMDLVHTEWNRLKYLGKNLEQLLALKVPQDAWLVLDDGTKGDRILARWGIERSKIHFLPNGVDTHWAELELDKEKAREELGIDRSMKVVLFLARLVPSKRAHLIVEVAPEVLRLAGPALFLFAGEGPEKARCRRLAAELGVESAVRFLGSVPHRRVPQVMAASDLFVAVSSLTNMALPTCEAMLCGLPVVAFDVGDTSRVVLDGETGRLVPDGDKNALAAALASVIGDDCAREKMGERARRHAREIFTSWEERMRIEQAVVTELVARRRCWRITP